MRDLKIIAIILALGLIRLLRPIVTFRFGALFVSRLGHLAGNTECYLCEKDAGINRHKRVIDIWCPIGKPANEQLFTMFKRVIHVSAWGGLIMQAGQHCEWFKKNHTFDDAQWGRDTHNLMEKSPPHLSFTKAEVKRGERGLRMLGLPEGAKWVCIAQRDPLFLKMVEPWLDYSYHDFRNSSIQNYREAAMALMDRGYYVLRMGQFVEEAMKLQAPMFIDYARHPLRCDFMDVYLGAKCAFTLSNGLGFDGIPTVFRRPICFVNEAPFEYLSTWMPNSLAIWKHHIKDGKRMTPAEIAASGAGLFHTSKQYADAGITLEENSAAEILEAALELEYLMTNWTASKDEQQKFWSRFPRSNSPHTGERLHGEIKLRIGSNFLKSYEN
jgi:putative glycosyltransferase (TIGR04372 family)